MPAFGGKGATCSESVGARGPFYLHVITSALVGRVGGLLEALATIKHGHGKGSGGEPSKQAPRSRSPPGAGPPMLQNLTPSDAVCDRFVQRKVILAY